MPQQVSQDLPQPAGVEQDQKKMYVLIRCTHVSGQHPLALINNQASCFLLLLWSFEGGGGGGGGSRKLMDKAQSPLSGIQPEQKQGVALVMLLFLSRLRYSAAHYLPFLWTMLRPPCPPPKQRQRHCIAVEQK